uniref:Replication factor C subunit 2 n=1 Tax=Blastobotrys adeninivorans TaxID=409370 RepID=A0A060TE21_BLAAD
MSFFTKGATSSAAKPDTKRVVPWVEKYRPKSLNDVAAQDHAIAILKKGLESGNLPHMLFYGPPGTGKTSTILALARDLYGPEMVKSRVLELNASDERGISIVRDKVKNFARSKVSVPSDHTKQNYPCPPYKLIILDEADSMTADAQSALRRIMENYSKITRFCLICNYVTRIIDPIASRCSKFRFKMLDETNALDRLQLIAKSEGLKYEQEALTTLLQKAAGGDLRKAITLLQSAARLQLKGLDEAQDPEELPDAPAEDEQLPEDTITPSIIYEVSGTVPQDTVNDVVKACRGENASGDKNAVFKNVKDAIQSVVLAGWSASQLVIQLHDNLIHDEMISASQKNQVAWNLSEVDKRLSDGADEHLELLDLAFKLAKILA